jgi:hypothetical protein
MPHTVAPRGGVDIDPSRHPIVTDQPLVDARTDVRVVVPVVATTSLASGPISQKRTDDSKAPARLRQSPQMWSSPLGALLIP